MDIRNEFIVFGQLLDPIDEINQAIINHNKILYFNYDDDYLIGKYLTEDLFNQICCEDSGDPFYWFSKVFIKNPIVVKNNSIGNLPTGVFSIYLIDQVEEDDN